VEERVRLDKWLWAARFFKTRTLAHDAVEGGRVHLNGERTKPSRALRVGDELTITRGQVRHVVVIRALSDHRGSAAIASKRYVETEASVKEREQMLVFLRATALPDPRKEIRGRPSKRDRRQIDRLRQR
jgi:ribosome-associated heat shock protein Hsp15